MNDVEHKGAAVEVTAPSEKAVAVVPKIWLKPRLQTWPLVDQTEGNLGHGGDSHSCIS